MSPLVARGVLRGRGLSPLVVIGLALAALASCKPKVPAIDARFEDTFDRAEPGPVWFDTGGGYGILDGQLRIQGAYNHPLWLKRRLPMNVVIEFDSTSMSPAGDTKFEIFGDGESFDPDRGSYQPTGYVFIFGGWQNTRSVICRLDEHNAGQKVWRDDRKVEMGRTYHHVVKRQGGKLDWSIDGQPFLAWQDPEPLYGNANAYFGFNNWDADVRFDNLVITPL